MCALPLGYASDNYPPNLYLEELFVLPCPRESLSVSRIFQTKARTCMHARTHVERSLAREGVLGGAPACRIPLGPIRIRKESQAQRRTMRIFTERQWELNGAIPLRCLISAVHVAREAQGPRLYTNLHEPPWASSIGKVTMTTNVRKNKLCKKICEQASLARRRQMWCETEIARGRA